MRFSIFLLLLVFLVACTSQTQVVIHNATLHNLSEIPVNGSSPYELDDLDEELLGIKVQNGSGNESMVSAEMVTGNPRSSNLDVSLVGVNSLGDTCGIRVNDKTYWIEEGSVERVNGLTIRVFEAFILHSNPDRGACELMIGGSLMELTS